MESSDCDIRGLFEHELLVLLDFVAFRCDGTPSGLEVITAQFLPLPPGISLGNMFPL